MKNLGKILLLIFVSEYYLFGAVDASVDSRNVALGDSVTLRLNISGKDIKKPNLYTICGSNVTSSGSQTSIQMINGSYSKSYILSYSFEPSQSCQIKSIDVNVDGKIEKSNPINITVNKNPVQTKNTNFSLTLKTDKKSVYVGEPFTVTLVLKQRRDASAVDSQFIEPKLDGFWIKNKSNPIRVRNGEYLITKVKYTMAAQRDTNLTIYPAQIKIASRDNRQDMWGMFSQNLKWKSYFSNKLLINVKALPAGVNLVGNFRLGEKVNKTTIAKGEALNLTVEVQGDGDLEDIQSFKPYIDGINVFAQKIKIDNKQKLLKQELAFVADNNFTIPSFKLKYFDLKTKSVKTIKTEPLKIKVLGATANKQEKLVIKQSAPTTTVTKQLKNSDNISILWIIFSFLFGLVIGILLSLFKPWKMINKKDNHINIKDEKTLLIKLFPFRDDIEVQKIVDILEKNIYLNKKIKIDKKVLKELLKKYLG